MTNKGIEPLIKKPAHEDRDIPVAVARALGKTKSNDTVIPLANSGSHGELKGEVGHE